jgi:molybdopterin-guanine dinucleotide biosynthesis protein A
VAAADQRDAAVGFVAAGGRSTRMGRDKALLPWHGGTLLHHALARLREACADVRILCGPAARYEDLGAPLVLDAVTGRGPLAGLHAALAAAGGRRVVLLGVDLPFVPGALLAWLAGAFPGADAAVPVTAAGPEPLCAAYGPGCLGPVARALEGDPRMTAFWDDVRVEAVSTDDLRRFGDPRTMFRNVNDLAGYEAARRG